MDQQKYAEPPRFLLERYNSPDVDRVASMMAKVCVAGVSKMGPIVEGIKKCKSMVTLSFFFKNIFCALFGFLIITYFMTPVW